MAVRFEELYERYRTGTATAEEAARVEEELAKFRLFTDHVAQHDELDLPEPPTEAEAREYRAVKRRARRSRRETVRLAVILTCAVLLVGRLLLWPLLNRFFFYNPQRENLEQAMAVYSSLFFPTRSCSGAYAENTGLGRWEVTLQMGDWTGGGRRPARMQGAVHLWDLSFEDAFWEGYCPVNQWKSAGDGGEYAPGQSPAETAKKLRELPDYTQGVLCLSFDRDLSMDELAGLMDTHPDLRVCWVKVRTLEGDGVLLPPTGFEPDGFIPDTGDGMRERYPWLFPEQHREDADRGAFYENHFKDLLRYMMDQKQTVWELGGAEHDQYQRALDYVEAHGVQAQGVFVSGRPADLAALCGEEAVSWASLDSIRLYPDMK